MNGHRSSTSCPGWRIVPFGTATNFVESLRIALGIHNDAIIANSPSFQVQHFLFMCCRFPAFSLCRDLFNDWHIIHPLATSATFCYFPPVKSVASPNIFFLELCNLDINQASMIYGHIPFFQQVLLILVKLLTIAV